MSHKEKHEQATVLEEGNDRARPELARRRMHRKSTIVSGRTIGEKRERLETKNERAAARKKDKKKKTMRVSFTVIGFAILAIILVILCFNFINSQKGEPINEVVIEDYTDYQPTVEILDENASTGGKITNRMNSYIGQAEVDFKALGYNPTKVIIPNGSIRMVYFYLEGHNGYIKMTIDRGSAVSVEDADRLIRYLSSQEVTDFEYLDVRTPGKAYWK
ncbi:hypothetical protein IJG12_03770 [Candidatus Saccharibacteria bacterium]|nr:hypothetical protein [Candidatus Saccharibacteria bacterium]